MASAQHQPPHPLHSVVPALRINTDFANGRQIPFEQINSAPVTRKEMGFPEFGHGHHRSSEAFASDNWRKTMTVPNSANNSESNSDKASPDNVFSSHGEVETPESIHSASPSSPDGKKGLPSSIGHTEKHSGVMSPYTSVVLEPDSDGTPSTSPIGRRPSLARLIGHGYTSSGLLIGNIGSGVQDKLDVFELLPVTLSPEGKAVCQNHDDRGGSCACESFPLVEVGVPLGVAQSNGVCYPIEEVDESQTEAQPVPKASPRKEETATAVPKSRGEGLDRYREAERFEGLLGKLRKSAEDKCDKLIKEWKDPITGRSEPSPAWSMETLVAWSRRFNEYKDLVYKKYAPHSDRATQQEKDFDFPGSISAKVANSGQQQIKMREVIDSGIDMDIPGKERTLNPQAKEFQPPSKVASSRPEPKVGLPGVQRPGAPRRLYSQGYRPEVSGTGNRPAGPSVFSQAPYLPLTPGLHSPCDSTFSTGHPNWAALLAQIYGATPSIPFLPPCSPSLSTLKSGLSTGSAGAGLSRVCGFDIANPMQSCHHTDLGCPWTRCPGHRSVPPTPPVTQTPLIGPVTPVVPVVPAAPAMRNFPRVLPPALSQIPPGPVPKPRFPDSRGQQAYEEWIEWRKANEPGYALECKARQARRIHRGRGIPKSSPTSADVSGGLNEIGDEFLRPQEGSTREMGIRSEG